MKKISHKERIENSKSSIEKTKKLESKRMNPKFRKGLSISTGVLATGGIVAGATIGIMAAANTSALANYPTDPKALTAQDFIAGNKDEKPNFEIETSGSQKIIKATEGPVKFISNYSALFDEEKMGDFTDWFYHDVSWGPEIGALSSINFLSGVQSDNGKTTLGYHTTSREGSTIIMSPDVPFNWNKDTHTHQSIAFYFIKNYITALAGENPSDDQIKDKVIELFPDVADSSGDIPAGEKLYVALANSQTFADTFLNIYNKSWNLKIKVALNDDGQLDADQYGVLKPINETTTNVGLYPGANMIDTLRSSFKVIMAILSSADFDDATKKYYGALGEQLTNRLFPTITNANQLLSFMQLLSLDDSFIDGLQNQNAFLFSARDDSLDGADKYNGMASKIKVLYNELGQPGEFHLNTQASLASFETKESKIKELLRDLLVTSAEVDKATRDDKEAAVLSVIFFYYANNGMMGRLLPDGNHTKNYGTISLQNAFINLEKMSSSEIDAVDSDWIYSKIFSDETIGDGSAEKYTVEEIKTIKNGFIEFSNDDMTQLSQDMDSRLHTGKTVSGNRVPGLPIYKSATERGDEQGDSFYDSITRRISQDMLYTISHEYGHHTTMWYAQDISEMKGPENIGDNAATGVSDSRRVVPNSQVITLPSLDSYADAGKYDLFKSAFSTTTYKNNLDKTTDGDSRTDLTHQAFTTDLVMGGRNIEVTSGDTGIEGFTLLSTTFDPLYLGPVNAAKFGEAMEGNDIARDLLQKVVKEGSGVVDPSKDVQEYNVNFYNEMKQAVSGDTKLQDDASFKDFSKKQIIKSLVDSNFFGKDVNAYVQGDVYDENHNVYYISKDGTHLTINEIDEDGNKLSKYVGNPKMDTEGGTFGFFATSAALVNTLSPEDRNVLIQFKDAFSAAAESGSDTLAEVLGTFSIKDIMNIMGHLSDASQKYSNVPHPTNPAAFMDALKMYGMAEADDTKTINDVVSEMSKMIDGWSYATSPAPDPKYTAISTSKFEGEVFDRAKQYLQELNADSSLKLKNVTGEMVLRAYYEITGKTTKGLFELLFDENDVSKAEEVDGNSVDLNTLAPTIEEKIAIFTEAIKKVVEAGSSVDVISDFESSLHKKIDININGKDYSLILSDKLVTEIVDTFKDGGSVFTFKNGVNGVAAVAYTFTDPQDIVTYKHHFTTVSTGSMPPESFYRYTTTYVEALTRAWNQLAFAVNPELLTKPGEFYDGDPARFASEGELFYDIQQKTGATPTEDITAEGTKVKDMYVQYFNQDKTISAMLRARATGLYSFMGYTDKGEDNHIDGLVFTKPNDDGTVNKNNFVSEVDAIYGVDNYHYYEKHGDAQSTKDMTDRESFMTEFSVLGNFENAKLRQGTFDVWKWKDGSNGGIKDGKVQPEELMRIENGEIQHEGHLNNNGKSPDTAEIIGNPDDSDKGSEFRIKIGDIKV